MPVFCIFAFVLVQHNWACFTWKDALIYNHYYSGFLSSFIGFNQWKKLKYMQLQLRQTWCWAVHCTMGHTCCMWSAPNVLHVISTQLWPGQLSIHVGDFPGHSYNEFLIMPLKVVIIFHYHYFYLFTKLWCYFNLLRLIQEHKTNSYSTATGARSVTMQHPGHTDAKDKVNGLGNHHQGTSDWQADSIKCTNSMNSHGMG